MCTTYSSSIDLQNLVIRSRKLQNLNRSANSVIWPSRRGKTVSFSDGIIGCHSD
ncbi:hypothetical protein HanRHA438_Chr11g0524301 [Helianthus annuus]|nr:hypothetical protein HanRHA438_Chr11g0524301 [Helianthus annuus]